MFVNALLLVLDSPQRPEAAIAASFSDLSFIANAMAQRGLNSEQPPNEHGVPSPRAKAAHANQTSTLAALGKKLAWLAPRRRREQLKDWNCVPNSNSFLPRLLSSLSLS